MHIRQENEAMRKGQPCKALFADNHPLHIKEHMVVLNDVDIRNSNDPAVQVAVQHILMHIQLWRQTDPAVLAALGIQPPPPPPMMAPPGAPAGGPQQPPKPGAPQASAAPTPVQAKAASIRPPEMPRPPQNAAPEAKQNMAQAQANMEAH
jgi:hypothetical protein